MDTLLLRFEDSTATTFDEIYHALHDKLYCYALQYVPRDQAKDAVQDVFVKMLQRTHNSWQHFEGQSMTAVRNKCIDFLRAAQKHERKKPSIEAAHLHSEDEHVRAAAARTSIMELLESVLIKMAGIDRDIIRYYVQGYEVPEIAKLLNMEAKTVSNRMANAKRTIRQQVSQGEWALLALYFASLEYGSWLSQTAAG